MVQTINSLAHRRRSGQTALCLGRHQPCLLGEVAPQLCLHLRVRVLWLVHSSWDRPGKSQVQKTRSPAHHLQGTPQLSSCLLLKEVCQDRNKRRSGKGSKATFRPLRQTNRGMVLALNSFAHRPHGRRTALRLVRHQSCLLGVAAPQPCRLLRVRALLLVDSRRHRLGNSQAQRTWSLPHQLRRPLYLSPLLLLEKVCSEGNKWHPGTQREVTFRLLHQKNRGVVLTTNSLALPVLKKQAAQPMFSSNAVLLSTSCLTLPLMAHHMPKLLLLWLRLVRATLSIPGL